MFWYNSHPLQIDKNCFKQKETGILTFWGSLRKGLMISRISIFLFKEPSVANFKKIDYFTNVYTNI